MMDPAVNGLIAAENRWAAAWSPHPAQPAGGELKSLFFQALLGQRNVLLVTYNDPLGEAVKIWPKKPSLACTSRAGSVPKRPPYRELLPAYPAPIPFVTQSITAQRPLHLFGGRSGDRLKRGRPRLAVFVVAAMFGLVPRGRRAADANRRSFPRHSPKSYVAGRDRAARPFESRRHYRCPVSLKLAGRTGIFVRRP